MHRKIALILAFVLVPACGPLTAEDIDFGEHVPAFEFDGDPATLACASLDGSDVQLADPPLACADLGLPKTVCSAGEDNGPAATLVCCSLDGLDCALVDQPETCEDYGYPKTVCSAG